MKKRCLDCGYLKDGEHFYAHKSNSDGLGSYCKDCQRRRAALQRERQRSGLPPRARAGRRTEARSRLRKTWTDCAVEKPLSDFPSSRNRPDGRGLYCKPCHNARSRDTRQRLYGGGRHYHLRRRYGIGADEVAGMVEAQGGVCAICLEGKAEHVDHDHLTGSVRGILCFNCNGGLGQFRDRADVMERAIVYLRGTTWQRTRTSPGVYRLHSPRWATGASPSSWPAPHPTSSSPDGGSPSPPP